MGMREQLQEMIGKWKEQAVVHSMSGYRMASGMHMRLAKEVEAILAANPELGAKPRPGWLCKDRDGLWWNREKPHFGTDYTYDNTRYGLWIGMPVTSDVGIVDPWPDKEVGGPECLIEIT